MEISLFTTQPFTVEVNEKRHSLSNCEKTLIVIAGIAGLALFMIGAVFTFYGASYLLRKQAYQRFNPTPSPQNPPLLNNQEILKLFKKEILDTVEQLKPTQELQCFENFSISHSSYVSFPKIVALSDQSLRDRLGKLMDAVLQNNHLNDPTKTLKWSLIAKDTKGTLHAVVGEIILSLQDNQITTSATKNFYRNVESSNQHQLDEIMNLAWKKEQ
jgi:hypothetical protein